MSLNTGMKLVLQKLDQYLCAIGSANDAEDHGYKEDADCMRSEAREAIRQLLSENEFLADEYSTLQNELDTQRFLDFGWVDFSRYLREELRKMDHDEIV